MQNNPQPCTSSPCSAGTKVGGFSRSMIQYSTVRVRGNTTHPCNRTVASTDYCVIRFWRTSARAQRERASVLPGSVACRSVVVSEWLALLYCTSVRTVLILYNTVLYNTRALQSSRVSLNTLYLSERVCVCPAYTEVEERHDCSGVIPGYRYIYNIYTNTE